MSGLSKSQYSISRWCLFVALLLAASGLLAGCEFTAPSATPTPHQQRLPMIFDSQQAETTPYPGPPEESNFAVQVRLEAAASSVKVGETLLLTAVTENNSTGCQYPLYEISLQERPPGKFEFVSPQVIGPPGVSPATFEVRPLEPGTWELFAQAYGEKNCGEGWQWEYVTSPPVVITVNP
jgi:hypothetical protein